MCWHDTNKTLIKFWHDFKKTVFLIQYLHVVLRPQVSGLTPDQNELKLNLKAIGTKERPKEKSVVPIHTRLGEKKTKKTKRKGSTKPKKTKLVSPQSPSATTKRFVLDLNEDRPIPRKFNSIS